MSKEEGAAGPRATQHGSGRPVADRVWGFYTGAAVTSQIVIGDRLGLFKALAAKAPPGVTAEALAADCGLNARFLVEWLRGMAGAKLVVMTTSLAPAMPRSHSTRKRAFRPQSAARASAVTPGGALAARALKRPRRSPITIWEVTAAPV